MKNNDFQGNDGQKKREKESRGNVCYQRLHRAFVLYAVYDFWNLKEGRAKALPVILLWIVWKLLFSVIFNGKNKNKKTSWLYYKK